MGKYKDKVVIITGGGQGIGFGIAKAFAKEEANLVITGRTESKLLKAQKELEEAHGIKVLPVTADGGDEAAVKNVIKKTIETFGKIDVVINNAQVSKSGVMLADHSKETKGSVINFASGAGLSGKLGQSSYAAAKEGIRGMSRVAAAEWGPYGINVNIVCPLAMTEGLKKWREEYPDLYEKTIKGIPMNRFADAETDIGRICVFLASEDAKYITGETISVQGGSGLRP